MVQPPRDPSRPWAPSPFKRLAHTHALSVAGDAMFTTAMAGLVFFSVTNLKQARWQVAAALVFTIIPLSLAAPFIGPLIDRARGGRKWMIVGQCFLRGIVCFLLVWDRDNQLLMYPEFTLVLVLAQGYILARGALVPATVHNDAELVEANSKLAGISGVSAIAGGLSSVIIMWVTSKFGTDRGPDVALFVAGIVYLASTVQAIQLPPIRVAEEPADEVETTELHSPGIRHASVALSVIRVVVGLLTFMLAFHFKNLEETDAWASRVGLVGSLLAAEIGFLLGAAVAPKVRRFMHEEHIIMVSLAAMGVLGLLTALMTDIAGSVLLAFVVGLTSNTAKQAFDSIVQRDAPDANRGRAFAKFETRFQLWWVLGALVPVIISVPPRLGFLLIGIGGSGGLLWFWVTLRRALAEAARRPSPLAGEPVLVEPRPVSRSFIRGRRTPGPSRRNGFAPDDDDPTLISSTYDDTRVMTPAAPRPLDGDPTLVDGAAFLGGPGAGGGWTPAPAPAATYAPTPSYAPAEGPPPAASFDTYRADPDRGPSAYVSHPPVTGGSGLFGDATDPAFGLGVAHGTETGLFAVPDEPPAYAAASPDPVLYDSAAWLDEDDADDVPRPPASTWDTSGSGSPVSAAPEVPFRDPGPPSLVPPLPAPAPSAPTVAPLFPAPDPFAAPPAAPVDDAPAAWSPPAPSGPPPGPSWSGTAAAATPVGPPGWPHGAAAPAPSAVPTVPMVSASSDAAEISLLADDGTYPEPLWRDAAPQPLPGFEVPEQHRPASGD
jgi:Na+/melibiose symporter-like transporter